MYGGTCRSDDRWGRARHLPAGRRATRDGHQGGGEGSVGKFYLPLTYLHLHLPQVCICTLILGPRKGRSVWRSVLIEGRVGDGGWWMKKGGYRD